MTSFSFWLVEKDPSQNPTRTVVKQCTVENLPSGTAGDLIQATHGHILPELESSDVDISDLDIQVYRASRSQHSRLSSFYGSIVQSTARGLWEASYHRSSRS